jgi:hypothetical protein
MSNAGNSCAQNSHYAVYQPNANPKKFANDLRKLQESASCEKHPRETAILSCAKVLIFRKCRKLFPQKIHLRTFYEHPKIAKNAKTLEKSHLRKPIFSQMFLVNTYT